VSERKLKHNSFSVMCKMWYESLPHLHILACTRGWLSFRTQSQSLHLKMHWHMNMCEHSPTHKHKLSPCMEKHLCAVKKSADTCSGGCQNIVLSCKTISQDKLPRVQSTVSVQARVNAAHWQRP